MGVERWLYERLGKPKIDVRGEVLTDLFGPAPLLDWISVDDDMATASLQASPAVLGPLDRVMVRGSCDMGALLHYFRTANAESHAEYNIYRNDMALRVEHSNFLRYAVEGISPAALNAAHQLGFTQEDFRTFLFEPQGQPLILLSFSADATKVLYRHRASGLCVSCQLSARMPHSRDGRLQPMEQWPENDQLAWKLAAKQFLAGEFDYVGLISEHDFKHNLELLLYSVPVLAVVVIVETNEWHKSESGAQHRSTAPSITTVNRWTREVCMEIPHVILLRMSDCIESEDEKIDILHFHSRVYHRLYQRILGTVQAEAGQATIAAPAHPEVMI
jgi:hypothetical protein